MQRSMAPNRESTMMGSTFSNNTIAATTKSDKSTPNKPNKLSMESLQRTISDISFELSKEANNYSIDDQLPAVLEVEDAKCECCGMSEECTADYIKRVQEKFSGKLVCGLCAEAVNQEMEKNGGKREEALNDHMNACVKFNRLGRAYPVLYQAEAMREMFKKSTSSNRGKSISPKTNGTRMGGGLARSSSCMSAINSRENLDRIRLQR